MARRRGHKSYPKGIIGTEGNDNIKTNFASRVDGRGGDDTINSNVWGAYHPRRKTPCFS